MIGTCIACVKGESSGNICVWCIFAIISSYEYIYLRANVGMRSDSNTVKCNWFFKPEIDSLCINLDLWFFI